MPEAQARLAAILMQGLLQGAAPGGVEPLFQVAELCLVPDFKAAAMWARRAAESGSPGRYGDSRDDFVVWPGRACGINRPPRWICTGGLQKGTVTKGGLASHWRL